MADQARQAPASLGGPAARLLERLAADPGLPARVWPTALVARHLGGGPPPLRTLVEALREQGYRAHVSAVMAGQLRTDAPWPELLALARRLTCPS